MLVNHPELKSELLKIEDTLGTFSQTQAVEPSAALKSRVMSSIQSDRTGSVCLICRLHLQQRSSTGKW